MSFTSGNVENSPFEFQKKGFLQVKKFRKDALHKGSFSRPYWFVIKDSFLIWYKAKPVNGFDIYPDGCLPMGGCMMYGPWADEKHGGYVFEVANKSFNEHSLVCRTRPSDTEGRFFPEPILSALSAVLQASLHKVGSRTLQRARSQLGRTVCLATLN